MADKFSEQLTNGGQTPKERLNWKIVRQWFREELERNFGEKHTLPPEHEWWTGKEISLAKKLLKLYGGDTIHEGIVQLCESWDRMVESGHKLSGLPTMGFLWATRERVMGEVEAGEDPNRKDRKGRHHQAEYNKDDDDMPGFGW